MNAWRQTVAAASGRKSGWQPTPAAEVQANTALRATPQARTETPAAAQVPGGHALGSRDRAFFEQRLGADFSRVRVHTAGDAAETADSLGARALAVGSDIAFAPGEYNPRSEPGRNLLAHELTHTLQQAQAGAQAVQMQGKQGATGLGVKPPKDDFTVAEKTVPSDDFVLFDKDHADLRAADQKKLLDAAAAHKGPVTVTIHGYASEEGDADYNVNLAAWRAAAVKDILQPKLDPKSKIILFSNGKTTDFGALEQNRRAGFTLTDGVVETVVVEKKEQDTPPDKKPGEPWTFDITGGAGKKPSLLDPSARLFDPTIKTDPSRTPGLGPGILPPLALHPLPSLGPPNGIDWSAIRPKFSLHGVSPDARDFDAIEKHWYYSYNFLYGILHDPALAEKGANLAVPFAVNKWLTLQYPNAMDTAQRQFEEGHGGITTYTVPLSDIVDAALQKILKKDKPLFEF